MIALVAVLEIKSSISVEKPKIVVEAVTLPAVRIEKVPEMYTATESPIRNTAAGFGLMLNRHVQNLKLQIRKKASKKVFL